MTNPTPPPEIDYDLAALIQQNKFLKDGINRQLLFIEALHGGSDKIRMEAWHSGEDMKKAEAILYDALRAVLLPRDSTKLKKTAPATYRDEHCPTCGQDLPGAA